MMVKVTTEKLIRTAAKAKTTFLLWLTVIQNILLLRASPKIDVLVVSEDIFKIMILKKPVTLRIRMKMFSN